MFSKLNESAFHSLWLILLIVLPVILCLSFEVDDKLCNFQPMTMTITIDIIFVHVSMAYAVSICPEHAYLRSSIVYCFHNWGVYTSRADLSQGALLRLNYYTKCALQWRVIMLQFSFACRQSKQVLEMLLTSCRQVNDKKPTPQSVWVTLRSNVFVQQPTLESVFRIVNHSATSIQPSFNCGRFCWSIRSVALLRATNCILLLKQL